MAHTGGPQLLPPPPPPLNLCQKLLVSAAPRVDKQRATYIPCLPTTTSSCLYTYQHCSYPTPNLCPSPILLLLLLLQPQGLLKGEGGLQPSLLIDSSTILPTYTQKLASTIATYSLLAPGARKVPGSEGPVFVDAPVSGGVPGAVAASLTFMVGLGCGVYVSVLRNFVGVRDG